MTRLLCTLVTALLTLCGMGQPGHAAVAEPMVSAVAYAYDSHATDAHVQNGGPVRERAAAYDRDVTYDAVGRGVQGAAGRPEEATVPVAHNYDAVAGFPLLPARRRATYRQADVSSFSSVVDGQRVAAEAGTTGGAAAVRLGQAGEEAVRSVYDIGPKATIKINGRTRVLDGLNDTAVTEVKNVGYQAYTQQLKDSLAYAQQTGRQFDLYVRGSTTLSGPLVDAIANTPGFNLMDIP